jgi:hypothetical protein
MDMDQAAVWLSGSILIMMGFVVVAIGVVVINNIIAKYWKPVRIFSLDSWNLNPPGRFASQNELDRIAPEIAKDQTNKASKEIK